MSPYVNEERLGFPLQFSLKMHDPVFTVAWCSLHHLNLVKKPRKTLLYLYQSYILLTDKFRDIALKSTNEIYNRR
jgi:hypothetical protein